MLRIAITSIAELFLSDPPIASFAESHPSITIDVTVADDIFDIVAAGSTQELCSSSARFVEDDGPGIHPDWANLLTEPFVREEASRNRDTGGAGLGLAIAKNLTQAHGGDLSIGTAKSGGARIEVRIPIYEY